LSATVVLRMNSKFSYIEIIRNGSWWWIRRIWNE
jgi:hypothetical protein